MANTKPFIFIDGTYDDIITNSVDDNGETLYDGGVCIAIEPVVPGKFLICSDVGQIYYDTDDNRRILLSGGGSSSTTPIKSFTVSPTAINIYTDLYKSIDIAWELSAVPSSLTLNGVDLEKSIQGVTSMSINKDTEFKLSATVRGINQSKSISAVFVGPIYYGASDAIKIDSDTDFESLISDFEETLSSSVPNAVTFTDIPVNKYAYYLIPKKLAPNGISFTSGGVWTGGFSDESPNDLYTWNYGGKCEYYIYRSNADGLGVNRTFTLKAL